MLSRNVKRYIDAHSFCPEYLFRDWEAFLDLLYAEGGRVSAIQWWDHCRIPQQHLSIGSGGYRDPDDAEYMFAETQEYADGFDASSLDEVKAYIRAVRRSHLCYGEKHVGFDLVPSFYLPE